MTTISTLAKAVNWKKGTSVKLHIAEETSYRNADIFLNANPHIKSQITNSLNARFSNLKLSYDMVMSRGVPKYSKRLSATPLNTSMREKLKSTFPGLKYEVTFEEGVFYNLEDKGRKKGFDFALYDDTFNLINFRNLCFGRRSIYQGLARWDAVLKERSSWNILATSLSLPNPSLEGNDMVNKKNHPIILGEIQFGNWALLSYDLIKAINIEQFVDIDVFIYITATGNLAECISSGTVNYALSLKTIEELKNIIKVPIWLIGLDFK
ncbi:BglII/BstYI family type II restriction endonuclease [Peribacillus sp. SCS-37]|uniref:BglII/BstYI family type II restriction endonuclease n=1 Tax=Paraperibacillus esterisolvens TaxID=3115296 RepID=UPI003906B63A